MLSPPRVRVEYKGLLFSGVGDGAKRIEQPTHKVIASLNSLLSKESMDNKVRCDIQIHKICCCNKNLHPSAITLLFIT